MKKAIEEELSKGPKTEVELWEAVLKLLAPKIPGAVKSLRKAYKLRFGSEIGEKTAKINLIREIRRKFVEILKNFKSTARKIQFRTHYYGRIYYLEEHSGKVVKKLLEILEKEKPQAYYLLKQVKKAPVAYNPKIKRAFELLSSFGLVELKKMGKKSYVVEIGAEIKDLQEEKAYGEIRPFVVTVPVFTGKIEKRRIKFDFARIGKVLELGLEKDYVSLTDVLIFHRNALLLNLPARLVIRCRHISERAKNYCKSWGIEVCGGT